MRTLRSLLLLLALPIALLACRDDGLGLPGQHDPDGGNPGDDCAALKDQASCAARTDCSIIGCPACDGGVQFLGCVSASAHVTPPSCPAIACEPACAQHTDEASCAADPACYANYRDPGTCDCNKLGCCLQFSACEDGPAQCSPSSVGPQCDSLPWDCGDSYAPVFHGGCQTGCVKLDVCSDDCRTTGCPAGSTCQLCWTSWECMSDGNAC